MSKYKAQPTIVDNLRFASKKEARRYSELVMLQKAKVISDLRLQEAFDLHVNGILVCRYVADFSYMENGKRVIEDAKGVRTPIYTLKRNLMQAIHGIVITES